MLFYGRKKNSYDSYELTTIFIPNAYSDYCTVSNYGNYPGYIYIDYSLYNPFIYYHPNYILGNTQNNPYYRGRVWNERKDFSGYFRTGNFITYQNFMDRGGDPYTPFVIDYNGFVYDTSIQDLYDQGDIESYKKVVNNADTLDLSKAYSYDALNDYVGSISAVTGVPTNTFDRTEPITAENYPLVYDLVDSVVDDALPFPDSYVVDDAPVIDYPLEDTIDPTLITDNIPIISDLKNKFPFSIPWDIASIISGLEAERETPYINTDVTIPGVNYTWHIEYDLSAFDDTAALFRTLFLIAFILGLAYFSYDHFFGS